MVLATTAADAGRYHVEAVNGMTGENGTSPAVYLSISGEEGSSFFFFWFSSALLARRLRYKSVKRTDGYAVGDNRIWQMRGRNAKEPTSRNQECKRRAHYLDFVSPFVAGQED